MSLRPALAALAAALLALAALLLWQRQTPVVQVTPAGSGAAAPDPSGPPDTPDTPDPSGLPVLPSGQSVSPIERIEDADGVLRFRFLAPQINEGTVAELASEDMQALCDLYALAHLPDPAQPPDQIVISLSQQEVALGEIRPDVVQFFEAYRIADGACLWEMF